MTTADLRAEAEKLAINIRAGDLREAFLGDVTDALIAFAEQYAARVGEVLKERIAALESVERGQSP